MRDEHIPQIAEFLVGRKADKTDAIVCTLQKTTLLGVPSCLIENFGTEDFVITVEQSADNDDADPYAAIDLRYGADDVSDITVVPGGKAVFTIETITKDYIRFSVLPTKGEGRLVVSNWGSTFNIYSPPHVPFP